MDSSFGQRQQLRQIPRMIPEQIVAGEILQLARLDLEQRLKAEFAKNPALTLEEVGLCPRCDTPTSSYPCPSCGFKPSKEEDDVPTVQAEDWETYRQQVHDHENLEEFATVAHQQTLHEYLHGQWMVEAKSGEFEVGSFLIDSLDADGYLHDPLIEIADRFLLSVPQVEGMLSRVQELEPAGVGARTLKECLLLQCARHEGDADLLELAEDIIADYWEDLIARRFEPLAKALKADVEDVKEAVGWIRKSLVPYPGRAYREHWEHLAPRKEARVAPDVIIRTGEDEEFIIEIVESRQFQVGIDSEYQRLYKMLNQKNSRARPEFEHVRRSVADARFIMDAIAQRRRTLYAVMEAVADTQRDFLLQGRAYLKPLMQKTIAAGLGVHESTVSRALADKMVQIPSGETIPTTQFFEDSAPVKEALRELVGRENPAKPLSDSRLAQLLNDSGYKIARRTIAKYRESLRIPPVEARKQS